MQFYNTLTHTKQEFKPIQENKVGMYTCGPTVYNYVHIGNLRSYVFADVLRKAFKYLGYEVTQIMNITDLGHLVSDADTGDDKMTKGLLREGKELTLENMRELAEFYTERFKEDLQKLNIDLPDKLPFASDYIKENIEIIESLEKKSFTYKTSDGVYFDTTKMPDYGVLWGGKRNWSTEGARTEVNKEKRNPQDFALWKFNERLGFPSPWGQGFPGWHIECSAMSMKYLGEQFDIHTGGIDHIPVHHTNEIAQSECATGKKPFVRYWLHHEFVDTGGEKMAKSADNFLRLQSVIDKDIDPVVYRFWLLMGSYHRKLNFSWEALEGAQTALKRLYSLFQGLPARPHESLGAGGGEETGKPDENYVKKFKEFLENDLDTPRVLTLLWDVLADEAMEDKDKKTTVLEMDKVLSLGFADLKPLEIPKEVQKLLAKREQVRQDKDFKKSDELRQKIKDLGFEVKDTPAGPKISQL